MVIRKPNGKKVKEISITGNGFYNLYEDLKWIRVRNKYEKEIEFYKELKLIKEYRYWNRLIDLLGDEIYTKPVIKR